MNVLFVCKKFPVPPRDGETKAIWDAVERTRSNGHDVRILSHLTTRHPVSSKDIERCPVPVRAVSLDNRVKPLRVLFNLLRGRSPHFARYDGAEIRSALTDLLDTRTPDVVQIEGSHLLGLVDAVRAHAPEARIVLRLHNIEHDLLRAHGVRGALMWFLRRRARREEEAGWCRVDAVAAISDAEARIVRERCGGDVDVAHVPMSVRVDDDPIPPQTGRQASIGFLGSMDWLPNLEAVEWFLDAVWPLVRERHHRADLNLAGRGESPEDWTRRPGVWHHGEVEDADDFVRRQDIVIMPFHRGGGLRIKMLEAMAAGRAIVGTTSGLAGIEIEDGVHALVADDAESFADAVCRLIEDRELAARLGAHAFDRARDQLTPDRISAAWEAVHSRG